MIRTSENQPRRFVLKLTLLSFRTPQFIEMENKASGFEKQSHMLISK